MMHDIGAVTLLAWCAVNAYCLLFGVPKFMRRKEKPGHYTACPASEEDQALLMATETELAKERLHYMLQATALVRACKALQDAQHYEAAALVMSMSEDLARKGGGLR